MARRQNRCPTDSLSIFIICDDQRLSGLNNRSRRRHHGAEPPCPPPGDKGLLGWLPLWAAYTPALGFNIQACLIDCQSFSPGLFNHNLKPADERGILLHICKSAYGLLKKYIILKSSLTVETSPIKQSPFSAQKACQTPGIRVTDPLFSGVNAPRVKRAFVSPSSGTVTRDWRSIERSSSGANG